MQPAKTKTKKARESVPANASERRGREPSTELPTDLKAAAVAKKNATGSHNGADDGSCASLDEANARLERCTGQERDVALAAGRILNEVKAGLFRERWKTFEEWCENECSLKKTQIYARRRAADVDRRLKDAGVGPMRTWTHYVVLAENVNDENHWAAFAPGITDLSVRAAEDLLRKPQPDEDERKADSGSDEDDVVTQVVELTRLRQILADCQNLVVDAALRGLDRQPEKRQQTVQAVKFAREVLEKVQRAIEAKLASGGDSANRQTSLTES